MKITCVDGTTFDITWCEDTIHVSQDVEGEKFGIEIPAEHVFDVINALRACADEHIRNNGEPPVRG